jgi:hypothetical protein
MIVGGGGGGRREGDVAGELEGKEMMSDQFPAPINFNKCRFFCF